MVIGIIGYLKSGKDTVADFVTSKTLDSYNFRKYSFAGPLKEATKVLFGWDDDMVHDQSKKEIVDPAWGISPRQALQVLGTDIMREWFPNKFPLFRTTVGSNFWVMKFKKLVGENPDTNYIIPDVRFPNECQAIKDLGGIIVRVHRDSAIPKYIPHPSENVELLQPMVDINIENNGSIDELWESTNILVKYLETRKE